MTEPIRLLLVEDNPGDADLTRDALETGKVLVDIHVAIDGVEALRYLRREPPHQAAQLPDLIILDLNLPRMDGRTLLAELKGSDALRAIPVVVLTSSDAEPEIAQAYALGAACYVTKPIGLAAFQSIVRSIEGFWFTVVKLP